MSFNYYEELKYDHKQDMEDDYILEAQLDKRTSETAILYFPDGSEDTITADVVIKEISDYYESGECDWIDEYFGDLLDELHKIRFGTDEEFEDYQIIQL